MVFPGYPVGEGPPRGLSPKPAFYGPCKTDSTIFKKNVEKKGEFLGSFHSCFYTYVRSLLR